MSEKSLNQPIDISFSVPYTHRLRVTDDVAGADFDQLLSVLVRGESGPTKVLIVAESSLEIATRKIRERLASTDSIQLISDPEILIGGEDVKNSTEAAKSVMARINDSALDRRSYIIAIGGGAMLDAVGYAAAVAHRGIRLVRLPTTTLAQADSGV